MYVYTFLKLLNYSGNISIPLAVSDSSCGEVDIGTQEFEPEIDPIPTQAAVTPTPAPVLVHEPGNNKYNCIFTFGK